MRTFVMVLIEDNARLGYGVVFPDNFVVIRWVSGIKQTVIMDNLTELSIFMENARHMQLIWQ